MFGFLKKAFDPTKKELAALAETASKVLQKEQQMKGLTDEQLAARPPAFRLRLENGRASTGCCRKRSRLSARPRSGHWASGTTRRSCRLGPSQRAHSGDEDRRGQDARRNHARIPERAHRKGRTCGRTVNDYLANRDSEWMGPVYKALGLTVGVILHDQTPPSVGSSTCAT